MTPLFKNRKHAGKALARELFSRHYEKPLILGLARGGVPVAYEIARTLQAPLDVLVVRKIGMPSNPEFALGAIAPGEIVIIDVDVVQEYGISEAELSMIISHEKAEMQRRIDLYKSGIYSKEYEPKTVILVDDGLATGYNMRAAVASVRKSLDPEKIVVAVPVCPLESLRELETRTNEALSILTPNNFVAVGQYYEDFNQVSDEEVVSILDGYPVPLTPTL